MPDEADAAASVDLAWSVATPPLLDDAIVAVPPGPSPVLHLANPGASVVGATVVIDGEARQLMVPAGGAASVQLDARVPVTLSGVGGLHASVSFADDGELASFGVQPPGPLDAPIEVSPR